MFVWATEIKRRSSHLPSILPVYFQHPNHVGVHEMGAPHVFLAPGAQGGTPGQRGLLGSVSPASGDMSHGVDMSLGMVDAWGDIGDVSGVVHGGWVNSSHVC